MNPETRVNNAINECVIVAREPDCVEDVDRLHELIVESTDGKTNTTRESLREEFLGLDYSKLTSVKPKDLDIDFNIKAFQPNRPIARAILAELPDTHEIVGYLIFHYYFTPWIGHSACVDYVYVVPSYRKQAIARKLLERAKEEGKKQNLRMLMWNSSIVSKDLIDPIDKRGAFWFRKEDTDWSVYRIDFGAQDQQVASNE